MPSRVLQEGEHIGHLGAFGRWIASKGWDIDDVFAYETVKIVRVRDYKLGVLFYTFQVAILVYLIVHGIILSRGYLRLEQIQAGSVVLNSKAPKVPVAPSELSYCCEDLQTCGGGNARLPCLYWDEYQAEYPVGMDYSTMVTSRVSFETEKASLPNCTYQQWGFGCRYEEDDKNSFFVAGAEDFTIRIRHGVRGSTVSRVGSSTGDSPMKGKLIYTSKSGTLRVWPDTTPRFGVPQGDSRPGDIVSVAEFLDAAGLRIDDLSSTGDSMRYDGVNVIVFIRYVMAGQSDLEYIYEPRALSDAEFKVEETFYSNEGQARTIFNRHGVRLIFVQVGSIGEFSFLVLLTTLVTGLALLAVATTITNFVMSYILSMRDVYKQHKYSYTEDFSVWRDMSREEKREKLAALNRIGEGGTTHASHVLGLHESAMMAAKPLWDPEGSDLGDESVA